MLDDAFLEELTGRSTCQLISSGSNLAGAIAVGSVFTGQVWGAVGGTAGVIAMQALGMNLGCTAGQDPDDPDWQPYPEDCWKNSQGGCFYTLTESGNEAYVPDAGCEIVEILRQEFRYTDGNGKDHWYTYYRKLSGYEGRTTVRGAGGAGPPRVWIRGEGCDPDGLHGKPPYGTPIGKPYVETDPNTGCTWTVTILDSYIASNGLPQFHYKAVSDDPIACGGPYEWWGNGDGPNVPVGPDPRPDPPTPPPPPIPPRPHDEEKECPDPCPPAPTLSGTTYQLTGVCEDVAQGEPQPVTQFTSNGGDAYIELASRIDNLALMLQKHLELKTPTCVPKKAELKGDWRTISFISDETSPYGKSRLRKRLRYRSQSGIELGGLVDHWADFTWAAGPVCVIHKGSSVGVPQCWASSIDEGKRVLRHAFREAGVDPDQVGEWIVSGSNNARYGVPGTMRVNTKGGYYWITCREGSNGRPEVMTTGPNPYRLGLDRQF